MNRGTLYLVGTPIGNLGDITARASETLRRVSRIYAEDTRRTLALLSYLKIEGPRLLALHGHSSDKALETALRILDEGEDIALVTDAGMPSVSDPGAELVRRAHEAGLTVTTVPGPSAVTSAVALSGLVDGPFTFLGFLPRKGQKRRAALEQMRELMHPVVLFESPARLAATLVELHQVLGNRRIVICRELTKRYEETLSVNLETATSADFAREWLGEITLVVEGSDRPLESDDSLDIDEQIHQLLAQGLSVKDVATQLSKGSRDKGKKSNRRELYARADLLRHEVERQEAGLEDDDRASAGPPESSAHPSEPNE